MRVLALSDAVSPVVYSENFPGNLPPFDVVLCAGDLPGYFLEYVATRLRTQPLYVIGNHANAYLRSADDPDEARLPGGCINVHGRVVEIQGLLVAGFEGSARYRPGPHQYSEAAYARMVAALTPRLLWQRWRRGRAVDVLLTHAPPRGPHAGDDWPHRGVGAFNRFHRLWRPAVHVHGHVHLSGANASRTYLSEDGVQVINAFEFTLFEIDLDARRVAGRRRPAAPPS
jgi:uncharacterized protein